MKISRFKIIVIIIITSILALSVYMYFFYSGENSDIKKDQIVEEVGKEGLVQYLNVERGFSLWYPKELKVKEHDEGDTTYTIVFSDELGEKSFQIFFTPYMGDTITSSRFLKDFPDGKFTEPVEVVIGDNMHALVFYSEGTLGKLREVWFIHDDYLFEVTTYDTLDEWLAEIMKSWKFFKPGSGGRS